MRKKYHTLVGRSPGGFGLFPKNHCKDVDWTTGTGLGLVIVIATFLVLPRNHSSGGFLEGGGVTRNVIGSFLCVP